MTDDERRPPDSLGGKLDRLFGGSDAGEATDGTAKLETDTGSHRPTSADDPAPSGPKRPTDPPF